MSAFLSQQVTHPGAAFEFASEQPQVAVIIPCYNEAENVEKVVKDFQAPLPDASIYVFDNNSTDRTAELAHQAGALVRQVFSKGKGNVIRRMFADVDADVYVMVDGDDTYDATSAPIMVDKLINDQLDMVVGVRIAEERLAYRNGHRLGNRMLTGFAKLIFGRSFNDMLSGYRVFSKRFVKSFPAFATGFETETGITVHALELKMPISEVDTKYGARAENSASKLRTYRKWWKSDGCKRANASSSHLSLTSTIAAISALDRCPVMNLWISHPSIISVLSKKNAA